MHVERAHRVDPEGVLVRQDAVGMDSGEMDDRIGAGERIVHLPEIFDVAREIIHPVPFGYRRPVEDQHIMAWISAALRSQLFDQRPTALPILR